MSETTSLVMTVEVWRAEIRRQAAEKYTSIPMQMLDGISLRLLSLRGAFKKKKAGQEDARATLGRQELGSYAWLSAILIWLLVLLAGVLAAWLAGELQAVQLPKISLANQIDFRQSVDSLRSFLRPWGIHLWATTLGCLTLLGNRALFARFLSVFPRTPIEAMCSADDLEDLKAWLDRNARPKNYSLLSISIPGGILLGMFMSVVWQYQNADASLTASVVVVWIISSIFVALALGYIYPFYIVFPSKLGNYQFQLFSNDPSSSVEVKDLGRLYTYIMLITMGLLAFFTLGLILFNLIAGSTLLFMILFVWGPTIAFFFISQSNINKIIVANKRATLDALQHQIEALYNLRRINPNDPGEIPKKEELERLDKLVGLYERIKGYSDTSLDLRGILNVITILLLPLITWILNYWEPLRKLLDQMIQGK